MTASTSEVAVCCSSASASSRVRRSSCSCRERMDGWSDGALAVERFFRRPSLATLRLQAFMGCTAGPSHCLPPRLRTRHRSGSGGRSGRAGTGFVHLLSKAGSMSAMCHVWTAPSWQELSSRLQPWSVQPCVRPLSAAHEAAGHNALRGSGPGQKHAFDNALALVGCPDRRIDRLCITCCSPFPTFTSRRGIRRDLVYAASATGSL